MRRTLNEIEVSIRKAASGVGLEYGTAEDAGRAAAWLVRQGLDGVAAVLASIRRGSSDIGFDPAVDAASAGRGYAAIIGPSLIDRLIAGGDGETVSVRNPDSALMVIGLAGVASEDHGVVIEIDCDGSISRIPAAGPMAAAAIPEPCARLSLKRIGAGVPGRQAAEASGGADVPAELWDEVQAYAARTYVPASQLSRALGAGAGSIDND